MTSPDPMTREEMLDLAALDAFGLLDSYEAALYTRSFHHASAATQDEILQLQAELASDESLLPDLTPPADLRQKVIDRVARAIDQESRELAPLATIGRHGAPRRRNQPMRVTLGASGQFWRAASFALIASLIVVLYFLSDTIKESNAIVKLSLSKLTVEQIEMLEELEDKLGPHYIDFISSPDVKRHVLISTNGDKQPWANVYLNDVTNQAFLLVRGMKNTTTDDFVLQAITNDGETIELAKFRGSMDFHGLRIDQIAATLLTTATFQIANLSGEVLLTSS